jgi:hypothetical protein
MDGTGPHGPVFFWSFLGDLSPDNVTPAAAS